MSAHDPRIDAYIAKSAPFARPILTHLRAVVHAGCPHVEETMKWSFPHFDYKGMMCAMAAFKNHCTFGFWKGALLEAKGLQPADEKAMGQFGRITSLSDLPSRKALVTLVKAAVALNDQGVKAPRTTRAKKPPLKISAEVMKALKENAKAHAAFHAFSPSHQREYVEWITEAKTDATRKRRLETAIAWIAGGKTRHWKYAR